MKRIIFILLLLLSIPAYANQHWEVIACGEDTNMSSAQGLSDFSAFTSANVRDTVAVLMMSEGDNVRWRDDGTAPTTTVGFVLVAGGANTVFYLGDPQQLKFIEESTSSDLFVCLYK